MANVKFSQFTEANPLAATGFVVGYDSLASSNVRVSLANLKTSIGAFTLDQTLAAGATLTANRTITHNGFNLNFTGTSGQTFRINADGDVIMGTNTGSKTIVSWNWSAEQFRFSSYFSGSLATNGLDINFGTSSFKIGSIQSSGSKNGVHLTIVDDPGTNVSAKFYHQGIPNGLIIDHSAGSYILGMTASTYVEANDGSSQIKLRATGGVDFDGSATNPGPFTAADYLEIYVNGTIQYIQLYN